MIDIPIDIFKIIIDIPIDIFKIIIDIPIGIFKIIISHFVFGRSWKTVM